MKWPMMAMLGFGLVLATSAHATDAISTGLINGLTVREGYVMFTVVSGGSNLCSPCPADPGHLSAGGFCWVPETQKTFVSLLFLAKAQGATINGRVNAISSDCTMYQIQLSD